MSGALISNCKKYRYWLNRPFEDSFLGTKTVLFVMLNPSTADAFIDDPTIRRCINFAKSWGYKGLIVVNLYAYRATKPCDLWKCKDPVGPENNQWLSKLTKEKNFTVVCAWGANAKSEQVEKFKNITKNNNTKLWCLGTTKNGSPRHPLYIKADQPLIEW